jgi:Ca-activated chloride channel family protein
MDMSYLDKFNCIGSYSDAEDKESFRNVFKNILNTVLVKTTVQVNLNDIYGKPTETNVTMFFYEAGTDKLKYMLVHTLNRLGNPDTIFIDPTISYDIVVNTIPAVTKKAVTLVKHTHNIITIPAPQGSLILSSIKSVFSPNFEMRVSPKGDAKTLWNQYYNQQIKYIIGKYDIEILTIPRIYKTIELSEAALTTISIDAPGELDFTFTKPLIAQLFMQDKNGIWLNVFTFSDTQLIGKLLIQPGNYKMVYRTKDMKSSGYTKEKAINISSNKTTTLKVN